MKRLRPTFDRNKFLLLSFALPFLAYLMVMIIRGYTPFGDSSILYSDMWHQYYPFFVEYRDTLRSGGSLLYNWNMGLGVDYLGLISYYLASPLNLLSVLVPESFLLGYFSLLVPIKLGLAGLFFGIFLQQIFTRRDWAVPVFSAAYGLCAWALGYQWNIMWLDTFALLPLVVLGMVRLLKERKFVLYTLSLFLAIVCNYYVGFFVCIFVALSFFVYEICYGRGFRRFLGDLGLIFLFSLLAIAMTAFIQWPTLTALGDTYSSINKFPTKFDLNIVTKDTFLGLLDAMRQVAGNTLGGTEITFKEGLPNLYCGVLPLILVFRFFLNRKFKLREKLCTIFLLLFFMLSFIIRQLDYIWHGFHFTNMIPYRFSFLFSFVVLVVAYRSWLESESTPKWQSVVAAILILGLVACSNDRTEPIFLIYNLVFLVFYVYILTAKVSEKKVIVETEDGPTAELIPLTAQQASWNRTLPWILVLVMALELVTATVNFGVRFGGTNIANYPRGTTDTAAVIAHMEQREPDTVYYRAEATQTQTLNDDAINGYSGITLFSSSANVRVTRFMSALGYGAKPSYNRYSYEEASPVSELFLNLKYLISRDGSWTETSLHTPVFKMGKTDLVENNAYLPLGFMVTRDILPMTSEDDDAGTFAFQNRLFTAATGIAEDVYTRVEAFDGYSNDGIKVTSRGSAGAYSYSTGSKTGKITVSFTVPTDGFVCLDFYVTKRNSMTVYKNGSEICADSLNLDQMVSVGDCVAGDLIEVDFTCSKANEDGRVTLGAAVLNRGVFWTGYNMLNSGTLELSKLTGTTATGTVTATTAAPVLYTSIPYDENWIVTVDGVPGETFPVLESMVGVVLTPGEHTVTFTYHNTSFYQGLLISAVAALVFLGILLVSHMPRKAGRFQRKKKK